MRAAGYSGAVRDSGSVSASREVTFRPPLLVLVQSAATATPDAPATIKTRALAGQEGGALTDSTVTAHKSQKKKPASEVKSRTRLQCHLQDVAAPGRKP